MKKLTSFEHFIEIGYSISQILFTNIIRQMFDYKSLSPLQFILKQIHLRWRLIAKQNLNKVWLIYWAFSTNVR